MTADRYVSTSQVAKALGISVSTVKRWIDLGLLPAHKTKGNHRKVRWSDVERLAQSERFPHAALIEVEADLLTRNETDFEELGQRFYRLLESGDGPAVRLFFHEVHGKGISIATLADRVIGPSMSCVGNNWALGRIDVLHEHRASQILLSALSILLGDLESRIAPDAPVAIGGAPERDQSSIPSLIAQLCLLEAGWRAIDFGANTPLVSLEKATHLLQPKLVWLSVTHVADAERFLASYAQFYQMMESRGIAVAVGGHGLTGELRERMLYTTFGDGMSHLVAFSRLLFTTREWPRRGRPPLSQQTRADQPSHHERQESNALSAGLAKAATRETLSPSNNDGDATHPTRSDEGIDSVQSRPVGEKVTEDS